MGCLNHLGPWFGGLPVRLRQLPSKPSSNQSWVPGPFDAQNLCDPNVFFFFRDKGLWSYPFYTRIVRSFMYKGNFLMLGMTGRCSKHCIHHSHCCHFIVQAILRHRTSFFGSSIDSSQAGMMTRNRIKGPDKGRGDDLQCWPHRSYVPMNSTLAHGKLRTCVVFSQTQMLNVWWVYLPTCTPKTIQMEVNIP